MLPGWKSSSRTSCGSSEQIAGSLQAIGLRFDRMRAEARATAVRFPPLLHVHSPQITATASEPLSADLLRKLRSLEADKTGLERRDQAADELYAIAERLIHSTIADISDADDILLIGCHGSGLWNLADSSQPRYSELIDTARLAETFGKTVVADFPARDLARGGVGGPVEAHGLGLLLADRDAAPGHCLRGLLDVAPHATNFTMIPVLHRDVRQERVFSWDMAVGHRLITDLASRRMDPTGETDYGKRAAAGRVIPELVDLWTATNTKDVSCCSWSPCGRSALPLLYALDHSNYKTAALEDQLASATKFLVQQITGFVLHSLPASQPIGELLVMGEGVENRLLMRWLAESLNVISIRRLDKIAQDRSLLGASIAALAMLHVWHIPLTASRGGGVPRVLGNLTPGHPSNWQRVMLEMTSTAPWMLPLREAV